MLNPATFRSSSERVDWWVADISTARRALQAGDYRLAFACLSTMWLEGEVSGAAEEITATTDDLEECCDVVFEWPIPGESEEFSSAHEVVLSLRRAIYDFALKHLTPDASADEV